MVANPRKRKRWVGKVIEFYEGRELPLRIGEVYHPRMGAMARRLCRITCGVHEKEQSG